MSSKMNTGPTGVVAQYRPNPSLCLSIVTSFLSSFSLSFLFFVCQSDCLFFLGPSLVRPASR
jgi:hypothetical protein